MCGWVGGLFINEKEALDRRLPLHWWAMFYFCSIKQPKRLGEKTILKYWKCKKSNKAGGVGKVVGDNIFEKMQIYSHSAEIFSVDNLSL